MEIVLACHRVPRKFHQDPLNSKSWKLIFLNRSLHDTVCTFSLGWWPGEHLPGEEDPVSMQTACRTCVTLQALLRSYSICFLVWPIQFQGIHSSGRQLPHTTSRRTLKVKGTYSGGNQRQGFPPALLQYGDKRSCAVKEFSCTATHQAATI